MREALAGAPAPVVAVSPFVEGRVLKGPPTTSAPTRASSPPPPASRRAYAEVVDGMVADEHGDRDAARLVVDTLMDTPERRRRVATNTLDFAVSLGG